MPDTHMKTAGAVPQWERHVHGLPPHGTWFWTAAPMLAAMQASCRDVRGWEFDARDVSSANMYTVLHDECDDTDENVHIDYHATVRDRYHANGWVRQARLSSAPLSPATMDRFKQAVREQREAGYVVHVERYNELIRSA